MSKRVQVKTAGKVFEVIETLVHLQGAEFPELVEQLDMAKSTVHDYLQTLETLGYIIKKDGEYYASTRFLELGESVRHEMDIYRVSRPEVARLAEETGEHASLVVEENGRAVLLWSARGEEAVNMGAIDGQRTHLSATAPGKLILSYKSEERVRDLAEQHGLPPYTEHSITDVERLLDELEQIQQQGYATDEGEMIKGANNVAVPVVTRGELRGALTLTGPASRMTEPRLNDEYPELLRQAANVIELKLISSE